jgi:PAS domain S-box-containing protein
MGESQGQASRPAPASPASQAVSERLRYLEALVDGQSRVLEMISQGRPLTEILEAIARWVEAQSRNDVLASLLLLDRDSQRLLHGAAPSLPETFNQGIHGVQIGPAVGSCGTAAFTKQAVIVEDIANDPLWIDFRELALDHGLRACWSTPLIGHDGQVLGTFAMYYRSPRRPTPEDLHIIQLVTRTAVLAIEHKQSEEERERLRAREQQALRQAQAERQRLRDLFMQAPAAIAILRGPAHTFELINPLYKTIIGTGREVIGKPIREGLPELEGQGIYELLDQVYTSGEPYEGKEIRVRIDRDGAGVPEDLYFNFVYQPSRDETGAVDGILVHAVDVTGSVRARHHIEESEQRYRTLFSAVPVAIYSCDATGMIQAFNERAVELWGRAPAIGDPNERYCGSYKIFYPDGRFMPHDTSPTARILRGETLEERDAEHLIERPDGTRRIVIAHPKPLKNERGEITGAINCLFDITERKQAEEARRESEEMFRTLADNMPQLTWMAYPDGYVFWYNQRWYEYTGATPESQKGWGWQSVHHPDVLPQVMERWQRSIATGEPFEMVFPIRRADGVFHPFLTRIVPVKDEQGRVLRWFGANTDVTEQVRLHEALQASERALQEANQRKDEFLSIASHELRTPLTSAKANIQIIARRLDRMLTQSATNTKNTMEPAIRLEPLRLLLERSERSLNRLAELVDDLLDVSRIQAGKLEMRPQRANLAEIVREAIEEQVAAWPEREVRVRGLLSDPVQRVWTHADPERIRQVVTNYLSNALKYSPPGRPIDVWLDTSRRVRENAKPVVRVCVRDEGPGLTPEQQVHLFERFYRVDGIDHQQGSGLGLGLGLYISRTIVERHGGQVGVESALREGSTFWFTLPCLE